MSALLRSRERSVACAGTASTPSPRSGRLSAAMARAAALRRAFALAAVALLLVAAPSASADDGSDVITLTAKNFDAVVNKEKIIVRAPRRRHAPQRAKAAAPPPRRVASRARRLPRR